MNERVSITVQRITPLGNGRYKVKVQQTQANLIDMQHEKRNYKVLRNLGRGRYIMKESGY